MPEYIEREELNNGEKIVFNAIVEYFNKNKLPPTVRELCKLTGYKSTESVQKKLKSLELKGYVEINKRKKRTLRIKEPATNFVEIDSSEMLCKVDENTTFYDGILHIIFGNECKTIYLDAEYDTPVTLRDCYKIFSAKYKEDAEILSPIVIFEDFTHGDIYRYGNHDEFWEKVGETVGFA